MANQTDTSDWITISSGVSSGQKGAYVELINSTTFAATWMIFVHISEFTNGPLFIDLAIGAPGSEVIILDDQYSNWRSIGGAGRGNSFSFPMTIPSGSRISVRISDTTASAKDHRFFITISDETAPLVVSSTSDSSGFVVVDSGGDVNLFGNWHEMITLTTEIREWMVVSVFRHIENKLAKFQIAIGGVGSESIIWKGPPWFKKGGNQAGVTYSTFHCFPVTIPLGTRISCRVKDGHVSAADYNVGIIVT